MLSLVQTFTFEMESVFFIILVFLNLTPGLSFVVVFLLVIKYDDNKSDISRRSEFLINSKGEDETKISDKCIIEKEK